MNGKPNSDQRGIALIAALMVMLLMSALLIGFTTLVMSDQRFRGIDKDRNRAYYGAQSGLEKLTVDLGNLFLANVAPTAQQIANLSNNPPAIANVSFTAAAPLVPYGATLLTCDNQGNTTCNGTIQNGPYQGLIALKKVYGLDAIAKTASGGEVHLTRKVESVAIPVFQFGTFSDVDLSLFAGANFNLGGRIHTNGNLFITAQNGGTTTLTDKVTAVGDFIRARMQNGLPIVAALFNGTIQAATAPNNFRPLLINEGSLVDGVGSQPNANWSNISLTTYNGYIRDGGCPPGAPCPVPSRGTGAKKLELALVTPGVGGSNPDLVRRPPAAEDPNSALFGERLYGKVSLRILLSDLPADILNLPTVTATAPVRLGDDAGAGFTNDWAAPGNAPAGYGPVDGTHPPIARSPGLQQISLNAAVAANANALPLAPGFNPVAPYNSPLNLRFDMFTSPANLAANVVYQTIACKAVTFNQFVNCALPGGGALNNAFVGYIIQAKDGTANGRTVTLTAGDAGGANQTYNVSNTAAIVGNSFWMQSNVVANPTWNVVTCLGVNSNGVLGGAVVQFQNCSNVPAANAVPGITTSQLVAQGVGTIGGYIKIEIQKADHSWQDVTMEILNWGFGAPNQDGQLCNDPTPNAIIRLQRLRDNGDAARGCHYSAAAGNGLAVTTNSYDYWPQTIFDTREALLREPTAAAPAPAQANILLGGVMHYVALDVGNLKKWFARQAPYGASSGNQVLLDNNGYSVYFSDRRNNRADGTNGTCLNCETGEYGWEDIVNPGDALGLPNGGMPEAGEDVNANGFLDTYGASPNFLGVRNALPPGAIAPFHIPGNITPLRLLGRSAAMTSRAYLFRRALKLVNGGAGNVPMPGFTVITENPVYIHGDYNWNAATQITDPHSETSVIADAVTLLSNAWVDANAFRNPYDATQRVRATNWYRLAIIGGKPPAFPWPNAGNPNGTFGTDGGAHNFLRYLEWGNAPLTTNFLGSLATFYYSRQATGTYKFGSSGVYAAPNRNYNFDTDFLDPAKLPPLTPMFRDINALGFTQETRPGR
jgi:type IV pilus assembly PilX-like protein